MGTDLKFTSKLSTYHSLGSRVNSACRCLVWAYLSLCQVWLSNSANSVIPLLRNKEMVHLHLTEQGRT
jgi:hypothetical protein